MHSFLHRKETDQLTFACRVIIRLTVSGFHFPLCYREILLQVIKKKILKASNPRVFCIFIPFTSPSNEVYTQASRFPLAALLKSLLPCDAATLFHTNRGLNASPLRPDEGRVDLFDAWSQKNIRNSSPCAPQTSTLVPSETVKRLSELKCTR